MKNLFLISVFISLNLGIFSQSSVFSYTSGPSNPTVAQQAVISSSLTIPHIGPFQYIQFNSNQGLGQVPHLIINIPTVQNGSSLQFEIEDVIYADPEHYSILASQINGSITIYVTPEGIGGVVIFESRKFTIHPLGGDFALIFENDLTVSDGGLCATDGFSEDHNHDGNFCHGDCGAGILDVLVLRTAEANDWLWNRWNTLGEWFLFVESHNINGAFRNSIIPGKIVRISYANFTPDFTFSDNPRNPDQDIELLASSQEGQRLRNQNRADIVVLLTNRNYPGVAGIAFFGVNTDPNNFCITEVGFIDPSRFTMAHEIAHQFGCDHSLQNPTTCPHGMNLANGLNTIMAFSATNNRIQHFSNPNVNFAGNPTGVQNQRDNAQQIRAAFCESVSNNTQPTFAVSFTPDEKVCFGEPAYFSSFVIQGRCPLPPLGLLGDCGLPPYSYEWRVSFRADFTNSAIVGTNSDLELEDVGCPFFYLRLTVTSSDGLTTTFTRRIKCVNGPCPRNSIDNNDYVGKIQVIPNPVQEVARILIDRNSPILDIEIITINGQVIHPSYKKIDGFLELKTQDLKSGLYILNLKLLNGAKTIKLLVE
ncbi:MAG TPA: zinc-dependent metalloprotease [Saprospiraceae bacterium]|nr:zinc-dependent metalloprotease [Saprospiraceae bacterium]